MVPKPPVSMKQIITTHKNTDFDALASLVAASLLYPEAVPILPRQINPNVKSFLSIHKDFFEFQRVEQVDFRDTERLIVVDTNSWCRLDRFDALREKNDLAVELWDHHPGESDLSPVFTCHEPMGANITLMVRALKENRIQFTPIQATLFLAGLYEDTGNLTFTSICPEDAYAAAHLLDRKADVAMVNRFLSPGYGQKQKDVLFELLKSVERKKINGHRVGIGKLSVKGHIGNLALVVRMYMDITNVDAAFGLFESQGQGKCMVIGRSRQDGLNIGAIMRSIGGGGHKSAGSAMLKGVNPDTVEEMIVHLIEGNQQASVQISDLMSFPVITVDVDTPMSAVAKILRDKGCSGLPVVKENRLAGIISRRDFKRLKNERQLKSPAKAFMSTSVETISPGSSPLEAAHIMVKHDIGRLPVVEGDQIIGIITRSDTMLYFYDILPN